MSAAAARTLDCRALEKDASPAEDLTVACFACDPDNPRAVPRRGCKSCGGTGRAPVGLARVVKEIHESRLELLVGGKGKKRAGDDFDF